MTATSLFAPSNRLYGRGGNGHLTKRIYDAMRTGGTIASIDVASAAMRDKGLDPDNDPVTRTDFPKWPKSQLPAI
jgi:hypothetical protein